MKPIACYECRTRAAMAHEELPGPNGQMVAFCSLQCAATYGVAMLRAGGPRWCYKCVGWNATARGRCQRCGLTQQEQIANLSWEQRHA